MTLLYIFNNKSINIPMGTISKKERLEGYFSLVSHKREEYLSLLSIEHKDRYKEVIKKSNNNKHKC